MDRLCSNARCRCPLGAADLRCPRCGEAAGEPPAPVDRIALEREPRRLRVVYLLIWVPMLLWILFVFSCLKTGWTGRGY